MKKRCPVPTCELRIDPWHFMCFVHWRGVSKAVKAALYRSWRAWKKGDLSESVYSAAMDTAIKEAKAVRV